ncbi:MAG: gliding motility lipoprotein GldD [Deltaproteobacteria bacterium]
MKIKLFLLSTSIVLFVQFFNSCEYEKTGMPKPRTYPRVEFPEKKYQEFNDSECGFTFEFPVYAKITKEKHFFDEKAPNDCWYNMVFTPYNGTLYLTYYNIENKSDFEKLVNDSYDLVSRHDVKASGRNEIPIKLSGSGGMLFRIDGNVASHTQFYITDTSRNFIRGSLYFNNKVNTDSMQVIQDFIDKDIDHFIGTFSWIKK